MPKINDTAKAVRNGRNNERRYDMDLVDILSEEVVGIFNPLITDNDLRRLVLADAYAKECIRNHQKGTPSENLDESLDIVGEMIVDLIYGSDPEYASIFGDIGEDAGESEDTESEEDSEDSFMACVEKYIEHLKECCVYDEDLKCIGCGLCAFGYSPRIPDDDSDDLDDDDLYDDLGFDDEDFDDEDGCDDDDSDGEYLLSCIDRYIEYRERCLRQGNDVKPIGSGQCGNVCTPKLPSSVDLILDYLYPDDEWKEDADPSCCEHCGGDSCCGNCEQCPLDPDRILRFEVVDGKITIRPVRRDEGA